MATNFPTGLDNFPNPTSATNLNAGGNLTHSAQHTNLNDALEALENYVGVVNSSVPTSLTNRVDTISQFIAKTLTFYIDGELGLDTNNGSINAPFKSLVGLKNRVLENSVTGAIASRNVFERASGPARPESKQMWTVKFATNLHLFFKNKTGAGVVQTYDLGSYTITSSQLLLIGSYSSNPYDLSLANPNRILPKISSNSEYIFYSLDSLNGGMGAPYQGSSATFLAGTELQFWLVDIATPTDKRFRDTWTLNSSNFQTFNTNVATIIPYAEVTTDQLAQAALSANPGQYLFSNFRNGSASGTTTSDWTDVITWCEAGQLYSTYINALSTTRFSSLYTNPHTFLGEAPRIVFRWATVRIRDGSLTPPVYLGFRDIYIELYGNMTINERTPGASLLGTYYNSADAQSRINLQDYGSSYTGFVSRYDSYTNINIINLAYAGVVNTATNKLYYPNARYSLS